MRLIDLLITKPITTISMVLIIIVFGLSSYYGMSVRQFPKVSIPQITIQTSFPGASPKLVRGFVSTPLEQAISGVDGVDYIEASNSEGWSSINIWLHEGYPADKALTQVNAHVSSVLWKMPKGTLTPSIRRNTRETPVVFYTLASNTVSPEQLTEYIQHTILPQLKSVPGVKKVLIHSEKDYAMHIWMNPKKMASHHVVATDIEQAIRKNNVQIGVGRLKGINQQYDLHSNGTLNSPNQFDNLIIDWRHGRLIKIKDVAFSKLGAYDQDVDTITGKYKHLIVFGAIAEDGASNIALEKRVAIAMQKVSSRLPVNLHLNILWNTSQFSVDSINLVYMTMLLASLCVILVIYLFLGSLRALVIPIILIPLCLIGACTLMSLSGFSINTLTLLAFVLSIGLVVDDSIVVLENIHRHLLLGKGRKEAALAGAKEIFYPVVAMTLVVISVFLPIGFVTGLSGEMFKQFAFTVAFTVLLSGVLALSLSPMMCCYILPQQHTNEGFSYRLDVFFKKIAARYVDLLRVVIKMRYIVLFILLILFALLYYVFTLIPSELIPDQDQGVILFIAKGPTASSIDYTNRYAKQLVGMIDKIPENSGTAILTGWGGINKFIGFMILRNPQKGDRTEQQIIAQIRPEMKKIVGMNVFPMNRPPLIDITGIQQPVQFVLQTTGSYYSLAHTMHKLISLASKNPNILNIRTNFLIDMPQVDVTINRTRAGTLGVSLANISETLRMLLGEPIVSWFNYNGWSYPVVPMIDKKYRTIPKNLTDIYVRSDNTGALIPLSNLVSFKMITAPQALNQFQLLNSARLEASLKHGYTMGEALKFLEKTAAHIMPAKMRYDFAGATREFVRSQGKLGFIFAAALIGIFLMLSMKFNSFLDPLIVMISVPLSLLGALFCMHLAHYTLNIYTQIGLVMLIGLISKHGILIVDFANQSRARGMEKIEAVLVAAATRLRPVLMTTGAMVLGALPLYLATGFGSLPLNEIGLIVVGGMLLGSLLTLFVVPTMYTFLSRKTKSGIST